MYAHRYIQIYTVRTQSTYEWSIKADPNIASSVSKASQEVFIPVQRDLLEYSKRPIQIPKGIILRKGPSILNVALSKYEEPCHVAHWLFLGAANVYVFRPAGGCSCEGDRHRLGVSANHPEPEV